MAELLVRVVDKINDDPYLDAKCLKRGDVVVVCPDGWPWGKHEQHNPDWRILKVPGVSVTALQGFLAPEPETDPENPSAMLQARAFRLNLDAGPLAPLQGRRDRALHRVSLTQADLLALKQAKPQLSDPNVLD